MRRSDKEYLIISQTFPHSQQSVSEGERGFVSVAMERLQGRVLEQELSTGAEARRRAGPTAEI